jgi:predicted  nucleic acid-binding Zn-ribbon protein
LGAATLAAYADDVAKKPETDLREREQLERSINRANRGLSQQEREIAKIQEKIDSTLKEREDLQFKIRAHRRLTARNMVDLSQQLKEIRDKIMVR